MWFICNPCSCFFICSFRLQRLKNVILTQTFGLFPCRRFDLNALSTCIIKSDGFEWSWYTDAFLILCTYLKHASVVTYDHSFWLHMIGLMLTLNTGYCKPCLPWEHDQQGSELVMLSIIALRMSQLCFCFSICLQDVFQLKLNEKGTLKSCTVNSLPRRNPNFNIPLGTVSSPM